MTSYHPHEGNIYEVGADGHMITLLENPNAVNPTYSQLLDFLKADKTDEHPYTSNYECGDFAETLQNNAEKAGIRCAWVAVHSCDHAFNAFMTSDKGLVYIDDTGVPGGATLQDKILNCAVGQPLTGTYLFKSGGTISMGCTVGSISTFW